jgi:hypothetical protein
MEVTIILKELNEVFPKAKSKFYSGFGDVQDADSHISFPALSDRISLREYAIKAYSNHYSQTVLLLIITSALSPPGFYLFLLFRIL